MASERFRSRSRAGASEPPHSFSGESEVGSELELLGSSSRLLRELGARESLDSTDALVSAYNNSLDEAECTALRKWLYKYSDWFDERHAKKSWRFDVVNEIASLARIKPKCQEDAEFVRETIFFIGDQVKSDRLQQRKPISALSKALEAVDEAVFEEDVSELLSIAEALLCKLDPTKVAFTERTFPTNRTVLFALHHALLIVQRVSPRSLNPQHEKGIFQNFKNRLTDILKCQDYFPSLFYVKLVEQCFVRLSQDSEFGISEMTRRMFSLLSGCAYLHKSARNAVFADLDIDSLRKAFEQLQIAVAKPVDEEWWYNEYIALNVAATLCCEDPESHVDFTACIQRTIDAEQGIKKQEDKHLLRYGVIDVICSLALNGRTPELRQRGVAEVMYLVTRCVRYDKWTEEPTVAEALLDGVHDIIVQNENTELALATLEVMQSCENPLIQVS